MNEPEPPSFVSLDDLFARAMTHPELRPYLLAGLMDSPLYTLVLKGSRREAAGSVVMPGPGMPLQFMRFAQEGQQYYHVYTSPEKAREAMRGPHLQKDGPLLVMKHPGRMLLAKLQKPGVGVCFNACAAGPDMSVNDQVISRMLDGSLLSGPEETEVEKFTGTARVLGPEEYPTALVQPVFDFLKMRPEVLAAWILEAQPTEAGGKRSYVFGLLTTAEDTQMLGYEVHTVLALTNHADREGVDLGVNFMDYAEPDHVTVMRECVPFYAVPGFKTPPLVPE